MTRKKVKLAYITNDSSRKATFKKRKRGLMKKVCELSTLCDIDACAIIYSPYDTKPEIWPSPAGVQSVLTKFKKVPEIEQRKKMMNQETFLKQRLTKAKEQLRRQQRINRERELTCIMYTSLTAGISRLDGLSAIDLNDLGFLIDRNLKNIASRIKELSRKNIPEVQQFPSIEDVKPITDEGGHEWMMNLLNSNENLGFEGVAETMLMMNTPLRTVADENFRCWESSLSITDDHDHEHLWYRPAFFT